MATFAPFAVEQPLEQKIKCLADEELLEVWAESQQIESVLCASFPPDAILSSDFEQVIVAELMLRTTKKLCAKTDRP